MRISFSLLTLVILPAIADESGNLPIERFSIGSSRFDFTQDLSKANGELLFHRSNGFQEDKPYQLGTRFAFKFNGTPTAEALEIELKIPEVEVIDASAGLFVGTESTPTLALAKIRELSSHEKIEVIQPLFRRNLAKKSTPNDPLFERNPSRSPDYQWYLSDPNGGYLFPYLGADFTSAWNFVTNSRTTIAIVDDGVFLSHEDLENFDHSLSLNLNDGPGNDGSARGIADTHGTMIAGIVGATWDNGIGIAGSSFNSRMASIRLSAGPVSDLEISQAINWQAPEIDIYCHGWGTDDSSTFLEGIGVLTENALAQSISSSRPNVGNGANLGDIHVVPAGNGAIIGDNSNYDGLANSRFTIAVGAVTDQGIPADYSEPGANIIISAPSNGGRRGLLTTSVEQSRGPLGTTVSTSSYTSDFGGTSGATAIVAGTVALMLGERPQSSWRDIQNGLIRTATMHNPSDPGWHTNGAGLSFHHRYGAGVISTVEATLQFFVDPLPAAMSQAISLAPNLTLGDGNGETALVSFDFSNKPNLACEHVELTISVTTNRRSDLALTLISPSGMKSELATPHQDSGEGDIDNWTFMTVRNWAEGTAGEWLLQATDTKTGEPATITSSTLTIHGVPETGAPVSSSPILLSEDTIEGETGVPFFHQLQVHGGTATSITNLPDGLIFDSSNQTISGTPTIGGKTEIKITLNNGFDDALKTIKVIITPLPFDLGEGLAQPELPGTLSGDADWVLERARVGNYDIYLASPIELGNGDSATVGLQNLPQGIAIFQWATNSLYEGSRLGVSLENPETGAPFLQEITHQPFPISTGLRLPNVSNDLYWTHENSDAPGSSLSRSVLQNLTLMTEQEYLDLLHGPGLFPAEIEVEISDGPLWHDYPVFPGALSAPSLKAGQNANLVTTFTGPAELTFLFYNLRMGSLLEILIDEEPTFSRGPNLEPNPFQQKANLAIPAGEHQVTFRLTQQENPSLDKSQPVVIFGMEYIPKEVTAYAPLLETLGAPHDDFDGDGWSNLYEFAYGSDPFEFGSRAPNYPMWLSNDRITILAKGYVEDVEYILQKSDDLVNWETKSDLTFIGWGAEFRYFEAPLDKDGAKFYRLKLELITD